MIKGLEEAVNKLKDRKGGYVTRRDAAVELGEMARKAKAVLEAYRDERDTDVRMAVEQELEQLSEALAPTYVPAAPPREYSLEELARYCERKKARTLSAEGDGFVVDVATKGQRGQRVFLVPCQRKDGLELVRIYTFCGEADTSILEWALRGNAKLPHCAFAIHKDEGGSRLILVANLERKRAQPEDVKTAVKVIAHYGDWFERKLTGQDEF